MKKELSSFICDHRHIEKILLLTSNREEWESVQALATQQGWDIKGTLPEGNGKWLIIAEREIKVIKSETTGGACSSSGKDRK